MPILLDQDVVQLNLPFSLRHLEVVVEALHVEDILMAAVSLLMKCLHLNLDLPIFNERPPHLIGLLFDLIPMKAELAEVLLIVLAVTEVEVSLVVRSINESHWRLVHQAFVLTLDDEQLSLPPEVTAMDPAHVSVCVGGLGESLGAKEALACELTLHYISEQG